jgi:hypothetical protein
VVESGRLESGYPEQSGSGVRIPLSPPAPALPAQDNRIYFMHKNFLFFLFCLPLLSGSQLNGMTFEGNRFFPLVPRPFYQAIGDSCIHWELQPIYFTGHCSYTACNNDADETGLFEFNGPYNQVCIDRMLQKAGITDKSLLRSDLRIRPSIPWNQRGKFEAWGLTAAYYQQLTQHLGWGFSWYFLHTSSRLELLLDLDAIQSSREDRELMKVNQKMQELLELSPGLWSNSSLGDFDAYLRYGGSWDYVLKMKRVTLGARIGGLFPIAPARNIHNPASIAIGGDHHWGIYGVLDGEFELKQDLKVGFLLRLSQRFPRTRIERMPISCEPVNYGVLQQPARVVPGVTFIFSPYVTIEGLREGLGFRAQYTLMVHQHDTWRDQRAGFNNIPINIDALEERSGWISQYATLTVLYDFAKAKVVRGATPTVSFNVDIPVHTWISKQSAKTYGFSLRIESDLW